MLVLIFSANLEFFCYWDWIIFRVLYLHIQHTYTGHSFIVNVRVSSILNEPWYTSLLHIQNSLATTVLKE